ncbi:hypothetical protein [Pseudanabaena sp. UWO311]|nr:hypothetical protein [Pseudanabaena sp. UWO311]
MVSEWAIVFLVKMSGRSCFWRWLGDRVLLDDLAIAFLVSS